MIAMNYDPLTFYNRTYGKDSPYADKVNEPKPKINSKRKNRRTKAPVSKRKAKIRLKLQTERTLADFKDRSCTRKRFYATETDALKAIEEQKPKAFTYYGCDFCGGFHLTTIRNET